MSTDRRSFAASAHHPRWGEAWAQGQLSFERFQLRFDSDAFSFEIPLVRLEIERNKSAGEGVCFRDSQSAECAVQTFDLEVLKHPALTQQPHTRNQIEALQSGGELKRRLKITGYFLGGFALVALAVSLLTSLMVRSLVARIPPEFEQEVGDSAIADLKTSVALVEDAGLKKKLQTAAEPLLAVLPKSEAGYKFYIIQEPLPNACALPGGHVVVTTRLLEMTDRPQEITAALAHEIAHVRLKHHFRAIISAAGPYLIFSVFMRGDNGLAGLLGASSGLLVQQSFSQEYELEADAAGWDYLVRAGINPRALIDVLRKLDDEYQRQPSLHTEIGAFSSHPATSKRIRRLEAKWRKLKDKSAFEQPSKNE